jgi:hypothetical protein
MKKALLFLMISVTSVHADELGCISFKQAKQELKRVSPNPESAPNSIIARACLSLGRATAIISGLNEEVATALELCIEGYSTQRLFQAHLELIEASYHCAEDDFFIIVE